ncbi:DUF4163 domain-containing protein [Paenibacillus athensensis]|uniref:Uncharacterized protein n=1 Tax=Paenibacillus athensensis TaxID=1967502 RepID=A0A4Y8PSY6_9BACL|nr:DUF4163 domain-containing protein [Paenibacillus athensensis]MCD1258600.1 DUF4163 domain-containing protein [Paenibacillus athensensis]
MQPVTNRFHKRRPSWVRVPIVIALAAALGSALPAAGYAASDAAAAVETAAPIQLKTLNVQIAGQRTEVPGGISNDGDSYVGLAFLSDKLGLTTAWDGDTRTVSVSSESKTMNMHNESSIYELNGHEFYGVLSPYIIEGSTYVPLRFVLEQMGFHIGYDAAERLITIEPVQENALQLRNETIDDSSEGRTITIQYPQIEGWADAQASGKINAFLKQRALQAQSDAHALYKEATDGLSDEDRQFPFEDTLNYRITYNQDNKLSLYFETYNYTGGAHGMYDMEGHTFDLTTGEELTLQQAALGNPGYKAIINREINEQLAERDYDLLESFDTIGDEQRYFLQDDQIVVYFGLYEYTPYAVGMPEFQIPVAMFGKPAES